MHVLRCNRYAEALELSQEALAQARRLKLRKLEAVARSGVGAARVVAGDRGGIDDLRHATRTLEELSSVTTPRAYVYLWLAYSHLGDLEGMREAEAGIRQSATHFDARGLLVYAEVTKVTDHYLSGRWDEALALADALIGTLQAAGGHYLETFCHCFRGKIRLARGDVTGALDDSVRAFELAEHADEHILLPAVAFRGGILHATGTEDDRATAARIAASVRDRLSGHLLTAFIGTELPDLLSRCDQVPDIEERLVRGSPWFQALAAFGAGRPEDAADIYARIGDRASEALARLRAGERLVSAGRAADAAEQLRRARSFYEEVRATRHLQQVAAVQPRR